MGKVEDLMRTTGETMLKSMGRHERPEATPRLTTWQTREPLADSRLVGSAIGLAMNEFLPTKPKLYLRSRSVSVPRDIKV